MPKKTWTEEQYKQLRTMLMQGKTRAEMAVKLGTTKNAVIGKLYRNGFSKPMPKKNEAGFVSLAGQNIPKLLENIERRYNN